MESKEKTVTSYYVLCVKLKNLIRSGWKDWNVQGERLESVAEHIYATQQLAIIMYLTYEYKIDLEKVLFMLAIHELGETIIGDITQFSALKGNKKELEHSAVHEILEKFPNGYIVEDLFKEFDAGETPEARFAYQCDKLECDLQAKVYDQDKLVDPTNQHNNDSMQDARVRRLLKSGKSWSEMWLIFGQEIYSYDDNFRGVSQYALLNKIDVP